MTEQQLRNLADLSEQIYPRLPYTKLFDAVNAPIIIQREAFCNGIQKVVSNPTDFGLVTLETMFEFCQWASAHGWYYRALPGGYMWCKTGYFGKNTLDTEYINTTSELYSKFTTQNKEK